MPIKDGNPFFLRVNSSASWQPGVPASKYYLGRNCWDYVGGWHVQVTGPAASPLDFMVAAPDTSNFRGLWDSQRWTAKPDGDGYSLRSTAYTGTDPAFQGKDLVLYVRETPDEGDPQSLIGRQVFLAGGAFFNQPLPPDARTSWVIDTVPDPNGAPCNTFQIALGELILYLGIDPTTGRVFATRDPANALWTYIPDTGVVTAQQAQADNYMWPWRAPFVRDWQSFTATVGGYISAVGINGRRPQPNRPGLGRVLN